MRIGIYLRDYRPEAGGAHTLLADLMGAFAEISASSSHHYVILCDPAAAADVIRMQSGALNVTVAPLPALAGLSLWLAGLKYFSPLFRWIWRKQGRVERTARHYDVQLIWFAAVDVYECPDMPYIATVLDLQHRFQPFFPEVSSKGIWDKREQFYSYFLRRATYCLTGTETGKREIQYLYQLAAPRVRVFPLPTPKFTLDAPESTIDVRSRFGIDREYIFYPAQFWPHKNHANLILALKWLREKHGLDIALALSGSEKGNLGFVKRVVEKEGMSDRVHFLGFVSEEELVALYRQALALTFVTYFGPDNIPPLEAFALGCPVIASAVEGAREQYGDAVLHVDPSNPEDIGQAIWQLYSNAQLRGELIQTGFVRAKKWTSANYVKGMLQLFDEFAAVRRNWL